jgi:NitT/TauT family transport system substrate-binding protein
MHARRYAVLGAAGLALAGAAGCGGSDSGSSSAGGGSSSAGGGTQSLTVGVFGALSDAGLYIARDKGYFQQEGLKVKLVPTGTAEQVISVLAAGKVDAAGTSPTPGLFNAIQRGVNVKIAVDKGQIGPDHSWVGLVVRKDLFDSGKITSVKDLKGKKVALPGKGTATAAEFTTVLRQNGLGIGDVSIQAGNPADALAALTNKAVDAAVLQEPFVTLSQVKQVGHELAPFGDVTPNGENGIIAVSEKLAKDPTLTGKLTKAYLRGVQDYVKAFPGDGKKGVGTAAIVDILVKNTAVKQAGLYAKMAPVQFSADGTLDTKSIDEFQQTFKDQGLQSAIVPSSKYLLAAQ